MNNDRIRIVSLANANSFGRLQSIRCDYELIYFAIGALVHSHGKPNEFTLNIINSIELETTARRITMAAISLFAVVAISLIIIQFSRLFQMDSQSIY